MYKKIIIIIFSVLVILLVTVVFFDVKKEPELPVKIEKVTLGVESSLLPAAVWVAENKGYFQEEGLDLTIKEFESGRLSLLAMFKGDEDIDISAAAPTPIMFNSFDRQDFSIFATFAYAYEDIKVIARQDKGINNVIDLVGKKIGTPMGTTGQFFTETFLIYNSVSPSDVELMDIAPSDLPIALNEGRVDAIVIWEPHGSSARKLLEDKAIRLPSSDIYRTTFNFLTMNDFIRENPELLEKFIRAIDKATIFIQNNKEESQNIVAARLNLEKEIMGTQWDLFTFDVYLDQSLLISLENEARWAIRNGLVDAAKIPNYLNYLYYDALERVKPEASKIIH